MAQWLRSLTALAGDLSFKPSNHMAWLTPSVTAPGDPVPFFGLLGYLSAQTHIQIYT